MLFRGPVWPSLSTVSGVSSNGPSTQWDAAQTLTLTGTNFTALSTVTIDGVSATVTGQTSTTLSVAVTAAEVSGSPLRTSGSKAIVVSTGGTTNWSVTAWAALTDLPGITGYFKGDPANVGTSTNLDSISTWVDNVGTADAIGQTNAGNGGTLPLFIKSDHTNNFAGKDSVYPPSGFLTGNGHIGSSHNFWLETFKFTGDLNLGRVFLYNTAGFAQLYCSANNTLTWQCNDGANTRSVSVTPDLATPLIITQRTRLTTSAATELKINLLSSAGNFATTTATALGTGSSGWYWGSDNAGANGIGYFTRTVIWSTGTEVDDVNRDRAIREAGVNDGVY